MSTALFTAVLTLYLARELGPAGFGVFSLALGITGLLMKPSDMGTTQATARYLAERHGDAAGVKGLLGMALPMRLTTATVIAVALFALAEPISDAYGEPELIWPLRGVAIAFFGQSVMRFVLVVFVALRRISTNLRLVLSESAVEFTATVALVALGGGVTGAAFGRAVGYMFGALLGLVLLARFLGWSPIRRSGPSPVKRRDFLGYAGAMLIVQGAGAAFSQLDVLLIGAFLSASSVGLFTAPLRLASFLTYPANALAQGIAPRMARHSHDEPRLAAMERGIRYLVILQAALVVVLVVWAGPIVRLTLGPEFSESADVLRALAPFLLLVGINPMLVAALDYAGEGKRRIPNSIAALALNAAIDVVLIPEIGILGAAIGSDVAYLGYAGYHLWLCHRVLGLTLRPLVVTAARSFAAAAALAVVLALVGTASLSPFAWLVGLTVGGAVYLIVLLVSGEVSVGELRALPRLPARALRGR